MPAAALSGRVERHQRIVEVGSLPALLDEPDGLAVLEAEAHDPGLDDRERLVTPEALNHLRLLRANRDRSRAALGLLGTDDVLIVPGFMGSVLKDVGGQHGLIWISPSLLVSGGQVGALRLAPFPRGSMPEGDAEPSVRIESLGAVPAIYDVLWADLNFRQYDPEIAPFDWRKDIERSAVLLAARIRNRLGRKPKPLHLIAHSQGSLVARRAVQILGADQARRLINNLVLLGPASFGTFSAAFALAGSHESIAAAQKYGVQLPPGFPAIFQSFTGLYQLLPWRHELFEHVNEFDPRRMKTNGKSFWKTGADPDRLGYGFGWGSGIDTSFFNDRTTIILGDQPTVAAVRWNGDRLVAEGEPAQGDGTVPDFLALIPGVTRVYRAAGVDHMTMPMHLSVLGAVRAILRGDTPSIEAAKTPLTVAKDVKKDHIPRLRPVQEPVARVPTTPVPPTATARGGAEAASPAKTRRPAKAPGPPPRREPPAPPCRRLRVFSFDPLLGTHLDTLDIARITIEVPWESDRRLGEGPVGEYVEVVDYDPASDCFYAPVDLKDPRLTAQDGLPPSESDPQFHQQMTYAVAMATVATFEKALGRVALWAPHLKRDDGEEVVPTPAETQYVPRLRIYPHAFRDANAYYDPDRHALLFGYFPSREQVGGETMPGGTVFSCQSFDIIAHETTHALLHGLHRYFLEPSNPDVLAFHEAFADAVALFQHFSHTEVVRHEVARTRGDLKRDNLLGNLAWQFGQAMGRHRGALRRYITTTPDATLLERTDEPHERGAILMAALFRAFQNIYAERSRDLYQLAARDIAETPDRDLRPELVARLAIEATKSARHILTMCVRALDYTPPVDITFGEYLRALITADHDLVRDDNRHYRVAVIDAFRSWGIYPADVRVLDEPALLWDPPDEWDRDALSEVVHKLKLGDWKPRADRRIAFLHMNDNVGAIRDWIYDNAHGVRDDGESLGIKVFGTSCQSIPRNDWERPMPKFEIHSVRPCLRIGPDGEQRMDVVIEIVQRRAGFLEEKVQEQVDAAKTPWSFSPEQQKKPGRTALPTANGRPDFWFRGGCTLLVDPDSGEIRYCVRKSVRSQERLARQRRFLRAGLDSTAALYFGTRGRNPLAMLHADD